MVGVVNETVIFLSVLRQWVIAHDFVLLAV